MELTRRLTVTVVDLADGRLAAPDGAPYELVGVPVVGGPDGAELAAGVPTTVRVDPDGDERTTAFDPVWASRRGFTAALGQTLLASDSSGAPPLLLVGCGPPAGLGVDSLRRAAAAFVRAAGSGGSAALVVPTDWAAQAVGGPHPAATAAQALAEGAVLASYRFVAHRSTSSPGPLEGIVLAVTGGDGSGAFAGGVARGRRIADAVFLARDLVNEPPSSMTPTRLAARVAADLGDVAQVTVEVWDDDRITTERLGGLAAVARGSAERPRLVRATYRPDHPVTVDGHVPHVVLVGKGITFDSGGLSLKTPGGMTTMKTDMAGAAAVLATVGACADLDVGVQVTAIAPLTENMPGGRAQKPGDVLTVRDGQTIEVLNTDAEGRLVLADALVLAAELEPDAIIDLATLTGACVVALGSKIAGRFGNDEGLQARVAAASERAGEPSWPLPLPDEYRSHIESEIADMKNVGKDGQAGAISAALLLARFVGDVPWVHLDIAGPSRSDEDAGVAAKGGTGFGVRTLLELLAGYGA